MVTPVTQKLNAAKQKRFAKYVIKRDLLNMTDDHCPGAQSRRVVSSWAKREDLSRWMNNKVRVMQNYRTPSHQWCQYMKTPTRSNNEVVDGC